MAESSGKAFGRYLRTLRERRGLSLDDVRSLSQTFPETITKSYISRCENGYHKLALPKLIPLSRIYEVPADAVLERMELDLELDRLGGPDTEGKSFAELSNSGRDMSERGCRWESYAFARDALALASTCPVLDRYRDAYEQVALSVLNVATAAGALGRNRFALHETLYVLESSNLTALNHARACDRVAKIYWKLAQLEQAQMFATKAVTTAEGCDDRLGLAYMYGTRARIALAIPDTQAAVDYLHKSLLLHREAGRLESAAIALVNISECYLDTKRVRSARLFCEEALQLLEREPERHARAIALTVMGRVLEAEGRTSQAATAWHEAADIAKGFRDRVLRFRIDFLLLRHALSHGDSSSTRAILRRLRRLAPWIPADVEELVEYRELLRSRPDLTAESVAKAQRDAFHRCN